MMLLFLCGIGEFNGYSINALNTLCDGDESASIVREIAFNTLHWLFEAQDNDIIAKFLGSPDIQLRRQFSRITPFDSVLCWATVFLIATVLGRLT